MTSTQLNYVQVKALNKALGDQSIAFAAQDELKSFIQTVCEPLTPNAWDAWKAPETVFLDHQQLSTLFSAFADKAPSTFRSTERIEFLAKAFGWRGDAFMHKLKTEFETQDFAAWKQVAHIYARFGYGDIEDWLQALKAGKGLLLIASPTSGGKTTFAGLTTALINARFKNREILVCENSVFSANRGHTILESKMQELSKLSVSLGLNNSSYPDWSVKTEEKLLVVYDVNDVLGMEMVTDAAKSQLVIATIHGAHVQHALKRFEHTLENKAAIKTFKCGIALQMTETGRERQVLGDLNSKSPRVELVSVKGKHQVATLLEKGIASGLYTRTFDEVRPVTPLGNAKEIFAKAAEMRGWKLSQAHGGYINERYRNRPGEDPTSWGSYEVADTAEEALFWDGVETLEDAKKMIDKDKLIAYGHVREGMNEKEFVELAQRILDGRGEPKHGGVWYEDDFVAIRSNYNGLSLQVERKAFVDPSNHICVFPIRQQWWPRTARSFAIMGSMPTLPVI